MPDPKREEGVSYTPEQVEAWKSETEEQGDPEADVYFYADSDADNADNANSSDDVGVEDAE